MGVQGLNYCESVTNDAIWNYQLVVGYEDPATHFELLTHGNKIQQYIDKGHTIECREWRLQPEDYITDITYLRFNHLRYGYVRQMILETSKGQKRVIGMKDAPTGSGGWKYSYGML